MSSGYSLNSFSSRFKNFRNENYQLERWIDSADYYNGNKFIYSYSNVGIGTTNTLSNKLLVNGNMYANNLSIGSNLFTSNICIGTTNAQGNHLYVNGNMFVDGLIVSASNITAYQTVSDDRIKTIVGDIDSSLEKLSTLSAFKYKTDNELAREYGFDVNKVSIGLSAQQVQKVVPEVVSTAPFDALYENGEIKSRSGENYLTIEYKQLIPILVDAVKELSVRYEEIEREVMIFL